MNAKKIIVGFALSTVIFLAGGLVGYSLKTEPKFAEKRPYSMKYADESNEASCAFTAKKELIGDFVHTRKVVIDELKAIPIGDRLIVCDVKARVVEFISPGQEEITNGSVLQVLTFSENGPIADRISKERLDALLSMDVIKKLISNDGIPSEFVEMLEVAI